MLEWDMFVVHGLGSKTVPGFLKMVRHLFSMELSLRTLYDDARCRFVRTKNFSLVVDDEDCIVNSLLSSFSKFCKVLFHFPLNDDSHLSIFIGLILLASFFFWSLILKVRQEDPRLIFLRLCITISLKVISFGSSNCWKRQVDSISFNFIIQEFYKLCFSLPSAHILEKQF